MITVFGDDGYGDHVQRAVMGTSSNIDVDMVSGETLNIVVPGAEKGVRDVVVIRVGDEAAITVPISF